MTKECLMDAILHPLNLQYAQEAVRAQQRLCGDRWEKYCRDRAALATASA